MIPAGFVDIQIAKLLKITMKYEVILEILRDEINNNNDMDVAQAIGILNIFS